MLAIITQLVASGILSIKRAAVGATFDPKHFFKALVTSSYFLLRKSAQNPSIHTVKLIKVNLKKNFVNISINNICTTIRVVKWVQQRGSPCSEEAKER